MRTALVSDGSAEAGITWSAACYNAQCPAGHPWLHLQIAGLKLMLPGMSSLTTLSALQVILDEDGFGLQPEMAGLLMAQHYIRFQTMIGMLQIGQGASMADLLWVIADSEELSEIVLRRSEKKVQQAVHYLLM